LSTISDGNTYDPTLNMIRKPSLLAICLMLLCLSDARAADRRPGWCQRARFWMTFCFTQESRDAAKTKCRDCVERHFASSPRPDYGLTLKDRIRPRDRLVIFLHGLNSRPEDLESLVQDTRAAGLPCAVFRYPNDQRLPESAVSLAKEFHKLQRTYPRLRVSIVAHSMGGLVARYAIEDPRWRSSNVDQLVMIAPPNHGSSLARFACSLDAVEFMTSPARRKESGFLVGSFADGLAEATDDLEPDSDFLTKLNSFPRNPDVDYTIVLGTDGLLSPLEVHAIRRGAQYLTRKCEWGQVAAERLVDCMAGSDELLNGRGDGVVALERGRLDGVSDVIVGHFSHTEILRPNPNQEVRRVRSMIVARLRDREPSVLSSGEHPR
jgi:pimeloyl-ACP methyl ester carboxylesterase